MGRGLQVPGTGVHADQALHPALPDQPGQQLALPAARVDDHLGTHAPQDFDHGGEPLVVQPDRRLEGILAGRALARGR